MGRGIYTFHIVNIKGAVIIRLELQHSNQGHFQINISPAPKWLLHFTYIYKDMPPILTLFLVIPVLGPIR